MSHRASAALSTAKTIAPRWEFSTLADLSVGFLLRPSVIKSDLKEFTLRIFNSSFKDSTGEFRRGEENSWHWKDWLCFSSSHKHASHDLAVTFHESSSKNVCYHLPAFSVKPNSSWSSSEISDKKLFLFFFRFFFTRHVLKAFQIVKPSRVCSFGR